MQRIAPGATSSANGRNSVVKRSAKPSSLTRSGAPTSRPALNSLCERLPGSRGRPSQAEGEALGERILEAGWQLLLEVGFERFSFDRLARFARIGKPTIYARFANKEELLRELLTWRIEHNQREILSRADGQSLAAAIPAMAVSVVEVFASPEGRLVERLIDWLDYETEATHPSLRIWAVRNAANTLEALMIQANDCGETRLRDVSTAARFMVEGIAGHARMCDGRTAFSAADHLEWATRYSAMVLREFSAT